MRVIAAAGRQDYVLGPERRIWFGGTGYAHARESVARALEAKGEIRIPGSGELVTGSFLLRRRKAMGDLLALTATARALERAGAEVAIACPPRYRPLLDGAFPLEQIRTGQIPVMLDGWLERHPGRAGRSAAACFGDWWNLEVEDGRPSMSLDNAEMSWAQHYTNSLRAGAERLALVFEHAGWETRTYPRMRAVGESLADGGMAVFAPEAAGMGLRELASLIAAADLVVTGDTGPLHLAAAVGTPAVAVFGATNAAGSIAGGYNCIAVEPRGLHCWPCWRSHCEGPDPLACLRGVSPREVVEAAAVALGDRAAQEQDDEG